MGNKQKEVCVSTGEYIEMALNNLRDGAVFSPDQVLVLESVVYDLAAAIILLEQKKSREEKDVDKLAREFEEIIQGSVMPYLVSRFEDGTIQMSTVGSNIAASKCLQAVQGRLGGKS